MKNNIEEMVDKELNEFYSDRDESTKNFKLLLEFEASCYNYTGVVLELTEYHKKVIKAKEIKLGRRRNKQLF